jgi:hypothetical protein
MLFEDKITLGRAWVLIKKPRVEGNREEWTRRELGPVGARSSKRVSISGPLARSETTFGLPERLWWGRQALFRLNFPKKVMILWALMKRLHTFASHSKKWELAYVSTNQNQITVLRSQFGG